MRRISHIVIPALIIGLSLLLISNQAFASSMVSNGKKTPTPGTNQPGNPNPPGQYKTPGAPSNNNVPPGQSNTPGAMATQQAITHGDSRTNFKGTISNVTSANLTLTLSDGTTQLILLGTSTRVKIPTLHGTTAANLQIGMLVMVQAVGDGAGNFTARTILVIPGKPALTHRVGWVTNYQAGVSIVIQAIDGNPYTFSLSADTKILPADQASTLSVGSLVTIIAPRDPANLGSIARGIVVHPTGSGAPVPSTPTP